MTAYSLSLHNGSTIAREHNRRNERVCKKEKHIDLINGKHENIIDIKIQDAYKELFDEALNEYNEKQKEKKHPERCIKSYYQHVLNDAKRHEAYEIIVSIGRQDKQPPAFLSEAILKEYLAGWDERNPHLKLFGAYFHMDESIETKDGVQITKPHPHLHLDYIPYATEMKTGLKCQASLVKALNQQGFKTTDIHHTAQINWQKNERKALEEICRAHGLEIECPELEYIEHLKMKEYKALKEVDRLNNEIDKLKEQMNEGIDKYNGLVDIHTELIDKISELKEGSYDIAKEIVNKYKEYSKDLVR